MENNHIDRREWVSRHDPIYREVDTEAPVTLGNGSLAFTADVTGLQTLYGDYQSPPLCTMSDWGWHTTPNAHGGTYLLDDVKMTTYRQANGRQVRYATDIAPGDDECYEWLRKNPHRLNLMRLSLSLEGMEIALSQITNIDQRLMMYDGRAESRFDVDGVPCRVETCVDARHDTLCVRVQSDALQHGLCLRMAFPYADYHIAASDWNAPQRHTTTVLLEGGDTLFLKRRLDGDVFYVHVKCGGARWEIDAARHVVLIRSDRPSLDLTVTLSPGLESPTDGDVFCGVDAIMARTADWWHTFWEKGGAVRLSRSRDPRAVELERMIVQSLYIQAVHATGSIPPQETGLLCSSWYGKPHGEMFLWHCAFLPLWNHPELLERKLKWHLKILPAARENAARNGYAGARWPKMADPFTGFDGPSWISPLLIWQQPHLIYMLRLYSHATGNDPARLEPYWPLIRESADFMADFPVLNPETGRYELLEPLLPADEVGEPMEVRNPSFELGYWKFGLQLAMEFAALLGKSVPEAWRRVEANLQPPIWDEGGYIHYEISPAYRDKKQPDGVIPIALCGLLPGRDIDPERFGRQYADHLERDGHTLSFGGWFRGYHAMTETRLQLPEVALDSLFTGITGDTFVRAGYNCLGHEGVGTGMQNLPVYMPGNGALLLAMPLMAVGWPGSRPAPGFPDDGQWVVETENLFGFPF